MILKRQETEDVVKCMYDSSNVLASTYDKKINNLTVIFAKGKTYVYESVNPTDYMRFEMAESQGKVLNSHIKKYTFKQIDDVDPSGLITEAAKLKEEEANAILAAKQKVFVDFTLSTLKDVTTTLPEKNIEMVIKLANDLLTEIRK